MNPGPELDRLIAEKVMGIPPGDPLICADSVTTWSPSTNIAQAWGVVAKLKSDGKGLRIEPWGDHWACARNSDGDIDCCDWFSCGEDAPHSICLAALAAVGVVV